MKGTRAFVTGIGIVSPAGRGPAQTLDFLKSAKSAIGPLSLFPVSGDAPMLVGEVRVSLEETDLPRAHALALEAARQALGTGGTPPDAVVLGVTTGGMDRTERFIKQGDKHAEQYRWHGVGTVAEVVAREVGCAGPALTVSTACSSSAAAIKVALELMRTGRAKKVLAGGVDSLCRLTVHGFASLQLIDPLGARPLDADRLGMSVAEAAAMLVLEASEDAPEGALAELAGGGLSCDAHHPASPHPEGLGALEAMRAALEDASVSLDSIDYLNLHGTGTKDNDASEAKAVRSLFGSGIPPLSSIKGITGHPLAAAGAVEAVTAALCLSHDFIPANVGCSEPDPALGLTPVIKPESRQVRTVLSNSFGFGGNNAALVFQKPVGDQSRSTVSKSTSLEVLGVACVTGAGDLDQSIRAISDGGSCAGMLSEEDLCRDLPPRFIRRLKRLPRMALALAARAHGDAKNPEPPRSVFFGTGWGALSETYDFLTKLYESGEKFASAIDFTGSVHNAPASQAALWFKATGPNLTATGGDASFEQALLMAGLLNDTDHDPTLLIGADQAHPVLTPLFDPSSSSADSLSDGGAAFLLRRSENGSGVRLALLYYGSAETDPAPVSSLIRTLGEGDPVDRYGAIFACIPAADRGAAEGLLSDFLARTRFPGPAADVRKHLGEHASVSATAAAMAVRMVQTGTIPAPLAGEKDLALSGRGILVLGLGRNVTAVEVVP